MAVVFESQPPFYTWRRHLPLEAVGWCVHGNSYSFHPLPRAYGNEYEHMSGVRLPPLLLIFTNFNSISMKQYGYSDTTCEFFPKKGLAKKHLKQIIETYQGDEMCVSIEQPDVDSLDITLTREYDDYKACVPSDMTHDDWVADNGDDCTVEVFRVIEIDCERYNTVSTTEHMWLTWDQLDASQAWDYYPLCMSLVARVSSDINDGVSGESHKTFDPWVVSQLNDFIQSVYYRNHAFIDVDDYSMHAFRIPKPKNNDEEKTA